MVSILNRIVKHPWLILIVILGISGGLMKAMISNSRMETDLDQYMPQEHPAFVFSDQAEKWFNIKDGIIIAIENKSGIYNPGTIGKIKKLTRELQRLDEIQKDDVVSLYTAENIVGTEDSLDVKDFFRTVPKSQALLDRLRDEVRQNEMVYKRLVSADETVAIVIAEIDDNVFSQAFYKKILKLVKQYEGPEKLHVAGTPIVEGTMAYLGPRDMKRMVPIVILVIVLVLWLVMRSVKATVFTLLVVLISVIWTFGLMALFSVPIYAVTTMVPVMLIAIGVADGIHLYSHLHLYLLDHPASGKKAAVRNMIGEMWKPVVMTSVTTGVGFISLVTSQVYPIKYFGLFTAFGVMVAMALSLVFIPAGILIFGLPRWKTAITHKSSGDRFSYRFAEAVVTHKKLTFIATAVIVAVSLYGMQKVWINSSFLEKFEKDSDIVLTDQFINQHFGGTSTLNVILQGQSDGVFKKPETLKLVDKLQHEVVGRLDVVGNSFSLSDYIRRMNKVMHADDGQYDSIPDSREMISQYLLLYEMSGDPDNLWKVVDYPYKTANVTFQLKSDNSKAINSAIEIINTFTPAFQKLGIEIKYAGSGYKALVFTDLILEGQIISLILALFIVVILLAVMFRKPVVGLIGAVPIGITAIVSFGVMGLFDIPLSTTTALISSIAIGIGIDYAVHFLERYKIYAQSTGDQAETIRMTMHHSGRAIVFNAVVVIAGFLVLLVSVFPPNRALGALVSLNMFVSFVGTVTIMFLLLVVSHIYFPKSDPVSQ